VSGVHLTSLEIGSLIITVGVLLGLAWMEYERRRDEREVAEAAGCFCMQSVRERDAELVAELAALHPMPRRPAPPAADLGEPWRLPASVTDPARLVEQAETHD
jgi:hypothetical protein